MGVGAVAAMLPDLDVFLQRASDPLFQLEMHRQFSHSIIFAPVGALLVSLALWWKVGSYLTKSELYRAALVGFLTGGLLDACTSYGTQLLWPFSSLRIAWNFTPVVEPVFTLFLLFLALMALLKKQRVFQLIAGFGILLFLSHGALQQSRARQAARILHDSRGHVPTAVSVKPTLGNQILWRVVYLTENRVYTDAVRTGFFANPVVSPGESLPLIDLERDFAGLVGSRTHRDFERFSTLSEGYLIRHPDFPNVLGDGRYAMLPTSLKPLWGLRFDPEKPEKTPTFETFRDGSPEVRAHFLALLKGES